MADLLTRQLTMMIFDGVRLAVPLSEAVSIERTAQLQPGDTESQALGVVLARNQHYPVYALSRRLALLSAIPAQCAFCVCLGHDDRGQRLALACESVSPLRLDNATTIQPLPTCMHSPGTPVRGLYGLGKQLVLCSTTDDLAAYIFRRV